MKEISLSSAMNANLLALQNVSRMTDRTQERLATGLKINSALDNPASYYAAVSLHNRASDLFTLLDTMGQGIQTIKAATEGIESATSLLMQMKAVAEQVSNSVTPPAVSQETPPAEVEETPTYSLQDYLDQGYTAITAGMRAETIQRLITDGARLVLAEDISLSSSEDIGLPRIMIRNVNDVIIEGNGHKISYEGGFDSSLFGMQNSHNIKINNIQLDFRNQYSELDGQVPTTMVIYNGDVELSAVSFSKGGTVENDISLVRNSCTLNIDSVEGLSIKNNGGTVNIIEPSPILSAPSEAETPIVTPYVPKQYSAQFNELLEQYNMLIGDSSYKGINLLKGNALSVVFNEDSSSALNVHGHDISSGRIGLDAVDWQTLEDVNVTIEALGRAINTLRDLSSEMGNYYTIVENRKDFTTTMINVLTEGADNLTLADMNEESAKMLALQTRQQLGVNSLSLASEAAQSILSLF